MPVIGMKCSHQPLWNQANDASHGQVGSVAVQTGQLSLMLPTLYNSVSAHASLQACSPRLAESHLTRSLPVGEFKPRRDQRSACHRWNKYVLGEAYVNEAARLYPKSRSEKARLKHEFDLVSAVHEAEYDAVRTPPEPTHRFQVTLEPDNFTQEKYDLYLHYQISVHHENASKNSPSQFTRFLCDSPLERSERVFNGVTQKLGSYHQMYRLDGRLIAIGVLDLLPGCVSGVYFIYHTDFEKWSFGKLSALREACLALEGQYNYYYMGFYIHSCPKMRYKNDYNPQYFLDINTLKWDPLDESARSLMDKHHFVSLSELHRRAKEEEFDVSELKDNYDPKMTAKEAQRMHRGMHISLFNLNFPGLMTLEEMKQAGMSVGSTLSSDGDVISELLVGCHG
jgi:arginyl-tRNA---protein transferase